MLSPSVRVRGCDIEPRQKGDEGAYLCFSMQTLLSTVHDYSLINSRLSLKVLFCQMRVHCLLLAARCCSHSQLCGRFCRLL